MRVGRAAAPLAATAIGALGAYAYPVGSSYAAPKPQPTVTSVVETVSCSLTVTATAEVANPTNGYKLDFYFVDNGQVKSGSSLKLNPSDSTYTTTLSLSGSGTIQTEARVSKGAYLSSLSYSTTANYGNCPS